MTIEATRFSTHFAGEVAATIASFSEVAETEETLTRIGTLFSATIDDAARLESYRGKHQKILDDAIEHYQTGPKPGTLQLPHPVLLGKLSEITEKYFYLDMRKEENVPLVNFIKAHCPNIEQLGFHECLPSLLHMLSATPLKKLAFTVTPEMDLSALQSMEAVQDLKLDHVATLAQFQAISKMRTLRKLTIVSSTISEEGVGYLAKLPHLETLNLCYCSIHGGLSHLSSNTTIIICESPNRASSFSAILQCRSPLSLTISNLTDEQVEVLSGCSNLTALDLNSDTLKGHSIRLLTQLTELGLRATKCNKKELRASLSALTGLKKLHLSWCDIGDEHASTIAALTQLDTLRLGEMHMSDKGLCALHPLTQLRHFECRSFSATYRASSLLQFPQLETVNLAHHTHFTDDDLKDLSKLKHLKRINIYGCKNITDEYFSLLENVKDLEFLDITGCLGIGMKARRALQRAKPHLRIIQEDEYKSLM